jgi:hypothetical protein
MQSVFHKFLHILKHYEEISIQFTVNKLWTSLYVHYKGDLCTFNIEIKCTQNHIFINKTVRNG